MKAFFFAILTKPLFNILIFIYSLIGDLGIAVIIFTIILKLALYPLTKKQQKFQEQQKKFQPKIKAIQEKYKDDPAKLQQEQLNLMRKEKFNPAAGCLPIIIQMIIFITFYWILRPGNVLLISDGQFEIKPDALYSFLDQIKTIQRSFIGLVDLTKPNVVLAVLAGVFQFLNTRTIMGKNKKLKQKEEPKPKKDSEQPDIQDMMTQQMKILNYVFPVMFVFISLGLPAGLPIYWITSSIVSIIQHKIIEIKHKKEDEEKENEELLGAKDESITTIKPEKIKKEKESVKKKKVKEDKTPKKGKKRRNKVKKKKNGKKKKKR